MKRHNNIKQGTPEWHHLRKGKITGTTLSDLMGTPLAREKAKMQLVAESLTVGDLGELSSYEMMERGKDLEPEAIAAFEFETGRKVERTGFCEDDDDPRICQSPDGLIGETEAIEVKCMGSLNHFETWQKDQIPKTYYWQVIQYFVVNPKLETLYFVAYNPNMPIHPLHIIVKNRAELVEDIARAQESQEEALKEVNDKLSEIITI